MGWTLKQYRFALFFVIFTLSDTVAVADSAKCNGTSAQLVSLQGEAEVQITPESLWKKGALNEVYCTGARIRTLENSRVILKLSNLSQLRLKEKTTLTLTNLEDNARSWLDLIKGAIHVITRVPRSLNIKTPYVNAAVEGTEFLVEVELDQTLVNVFEGTVQAENTHGKLALGAWKSLLAKQGEAPQAHLTVKPRDGVLWSLYYPPVIDFKVTTDISNPDISNPDTSSENQTWQGALARSIAAYRQGDWVSAFKEIGDDDGAQKAGISYYVYRASLRLTAGLVQGTAEDLNSAAALEPHNSDVLSLQSLMATVKNDKTLALDLALQALAANGASPHGYIALSYAQQANLHLDQALKSALKATQLDPTHAIAWARLAEMWLSHGELKKALHAAQQAVILQPLLERTQTILGFSYLTQHQVAEAKVAFHMAMGFDSAAPLPRLGLGLATIKTGDLSGGRLQLEIAASLDPGNSLLRSYLGKAYFEEKRPHLAQSQYDLAKELDPNDPTPWLYSAFQKEINNRPVEALEDLQQSITLNGNRAVYRSQLLLDQDLAARNISLARIYADLGFEQRALVEGVKSLLDDPTNASAHVFLADAYAGLSRYDIARDSELLQAQMLQPLSSKPVRANYASNHFKNLGKGGRLFSATEERGQLFDNNRVSLDINAISGNRDTYSNDISVSGSLNRFSYRLGQYHFETEGFRENADLKQDVYNGFFQTQLSPSLMIQAETNNEVIKKGDITLKYDSKRVPEYIRNTLQEQSRRLGLSYTPTQNSRLLYNFIKKNINLSTIDISPSLNDPYRDATLLNTISMGDLHEIQMLRHEKKYTIILGGNILRLNSNKLVRTEDFSAEPASFSESTLPRKQSDFSNIYYYMPLTFRPDLNVLLGLSHDRFDQDKNQREQVSPKFGLSWIPHEDWMFRIAAFRTLKRPVQFNQTLEPSHIMGFNQFFDDNDATKSTRYGLGIDYRLSPKSFAGLELTRSEKNQFTSINKNGNLSEAESDEVFYRAYYYQAFKKWAALSVELLYDNSDHQKVVPKTSTKKPVKLASYQAPVVLSLFSTQSISANLVVRYVDQAVYFNSALELQRETSDFWLADIYWGYQYKKTAMFALGVKNIANTHFNYQAPLAFDTRASQLPELQPIRQIFTSIQLWF